MSNLVIFIRHGGCWGEGDIRKLAYFEASVDPAYASGKVRILLPSDDFKVFLFFFSFKF